MNARRFIEKHGIVMVSARHAAVPSFAAEVAGEPIRGSWWAHPKGREIFGALSELDGNDDVVFTKLIDGKLTLIHRRLWPALAALVRAGQLDAARLTKIEQEHTPSGKHVNHETPAARWLPKAKLAVDDALQQLGALADAVLAKPRRAPRRRSR